MLSLHSLLYEVHKTKSNITPPKKKKKKANKQNENRKQNKKTMTAGKVTGTLIGYLPVKQICYNFKICCLPSI